MIFKKRKKIASDIDASPPPAYRLSQSDLYARLKRMAVKLIEEQRVKQLAGTRTEEEDIDDRRYFLNLNSPHPEVKWAQRVDKVYLTVVFPLDARDPEVDLKPDGGFAFSATRATPSYIFKVDCFKVMLFDKVNVEESKSCKIGRRSIFCVIEKTEKKWWKRLLRGHVNPPHYLKVDSDKWVDEEDSTGAPDFDLDTGGMDFSLMVVKPSIYT